MKTSNEAFEAWASQNLENNWAGDYYCETPLDVWQACDAHWREKLQSEEMKSIITYALRGLGWRDNSHRAEEVIAAISKEMGV